MLTRQPLDPRPSSHSTTDAQPGGQKTQEGKAQMEGLRLCVQNAGTPFMGLHWESASVLHAFIAHSVLLIRCPYFWWVGAVCAVTQARRIRLTFRC